MVSEDCRDQQNRVYADVRERKAKNHAVWQALHDEIHYKYNNAYQAKIKILHEDFESDKKVTPPKDQPRLQAEYAEAIYLAQRSFDYAYGPQAEALFKAYTDERDDISEEGQAQLDAIGACQIYP